MPRLVVLAPVHIYDDVRVFKKEAVTLAEAGYDVRLYARTRDGRPRTEQGVRVRPVAYRNRMARFALIPRLIRAALREDADVYHLHNPDTLPIGFVLRLLGRRVVYDTHEDFRRELLLRGWIPAPVRTLAASGVAVLERVAAACMSAVIVTQEQLLARIPGAVVIGNPPIVAESDAADRRERRLRSEDPGSTRVLGYVGGISADRGLFGMLELVAAMAEQRDTRLLLVGYPVNDDALDRAERLPQWALVDFAGSLEQQEAFAALDRAHAGLILFEDTAGHGTIDPNKIYEYMTLGLPFVASAFPDWEQRIGPSGAGIFVDPSDPAASAERVLALVSDADEMVRQGRNGATFVATRYSWQAQGAPALLGLYERLLSGPRPGRRPRTTARPTLRTR